MTSVPPLLVEMSGGKPRARRAQVPRPRESRLHADVAALLTAHCLPDWKWRHIGAKAASAREGAIMKRMGVQAGWPDFLLISPHGSVRFLELKRVGEKVLDEQLEFRMFCLKQGWPHAVAWTLDDVGAVFDFWNCLRVKFGK